MSKTQAVDLDSLGQIKLFHETAGDAARELARQYVSRDGKDHGVKAFAKRVFPHKSDEQAYTRFMNCTNPSTREEFGWEEWRAIIRLGHEQNNHLVAEVFCGPEYQCIPVDEGEMAKRAKRARRLALFEELKRLEADE